ncbi:MAG: YDG domain-containing protein, partial [Planctomycetota bacterium]
MTGYNAATGTTVPAASIDRIVGRIDPTGVVDTTTRSPNNTGSANIRSAGSVDGASLYISGTQGISLITFGTQPTTSISISASNVRQATVFDNQLYVGAVTSGIVGVNKVGSGLPDSTATLTALSAGTNTTNNTYYFLDRDAAVPGVDELFVADGASGIKKYSFNGTAWTLMGTFPGTFFGIAIAPNGTGTDIYATTGSGGSAKGNQLVKITDSAAYNVAASFSTSITLATAASDKSFRGVTFAPVATTPFITSPTKTGITTSAATLGGNITVNGGSPVTNRGVVYSISNSTPSTGGAGVFTQDVSDSSLGAFTLPVSGLTPGATYFYQAYATNALGTAYTSVDSFTVPSNADRLAVTSQPAATTTYGTAVTFTVAAQDAGNVTATGYSGTATIAITGGTFAAGQTTTVSFVNGLASFTVFVNAGTGLTFSATSAGLTGVSSSTFVVQQKELTVTGLVAANKDYDGSAAATFTGGTLAGVIAADVGNVSLGTSTGAFSEAAAGANKSVTGTAAALTGSASSNYVVSPLPTVANAAIAPKVTSVSPFLGPTSGYAVNVAGAGFTGITGASGVTFNGIDASSYTFVSDTQLLVQTPLAQPTGTANVVVTVNGAASNPANFSQGVNQITYATATLTGPGSSVIVGQAVALTLTLSSPVPAATTFSLLDASNSNAVVGTIVVAANATVGTQSLTTLSVGAHSLVASYDGVATPSVAALSSNALSVTIALSAPAVDLFTVNGGPIQVVDKQ